MKTPVLIILLFATTSTFAQLSPEITSWVLNQSGQTGYGGIETNVEQVQYSLSNVYVSCTCIPGYDIGPWKGNPNVPANQNFVFKLSRSPAKNTGTLVNTPLGHIGVWSNGVSIFNAKDAHSYNSGGIWNQNAIIVEGASFDTCLGHPAPNGEYHHHLNPRCLYDDKDATHHSPIIGYAFDGFPVYGVYGYADTIGGGGITRMRTSYRLRNISDRTTLADGTVLTSNQYGPAISSTYPLDYYLEDFEYIKGLGDLDEHNGRFCITPEYPSGTYAYFVTIDSLGNGAFPYTVGATYYGSVPTGNTGLGSGHNTITEAVTTYSPATGALSVDATIKFSVFPNPVSSYANLYIDATLTNNITATLCDVAGKEVLRMENVQPSVTYPLDLSLLPNGIYFLHLKTSAATGVQKIIVQR